MSIELYMPRMTLTNLTIQVLLDGYFSTITAMATIVTTIATVVLAYATWKYIKQLRWEKRRELVQKLINSVIAELYSRVRKEMSYLENRWIRSIRRNGSVRVYLEGEIDNQFLKSEMYIFHRHIIPERYREKIEDSIEEYLEAKRDLERLVKEAVESVPKSFVEYLRNQLVSRGDIAEKVVGDRIYDVLRIIIAGEEVYPNYYLYEFWNEYEEEVKSKLLEDKNMNEIMEKIGKKKEIVRKKLEDMYKVLKHLIDDWVKEYEVFFEEKEVEGYPIP